VPLILDLRFILYDHIRYFALLDHNANAQPVFAVWRCLALTVL
jgi:hypothetical protein